ncbi:hypothetical protein FGADI_1721 [Fusarium gaditjirri]|uniref:Uncharacterized protein n=1 Tax=Fusarium gaditjirri TaxID=282569 RepID=A0A8H4TKG0_9HYPO|nr:hypothetical protein FGADI_1721 [Fusarium gaditjirri]
MNYPSGREHYHEPLPLRSSTQPHHALLFSQRPRDNRPQPIYLGSDSNFDGFVSPVVYISPQSPTTAEIQAQINAEFGALIGNSEQPRGEEFLRQRARLRPVPKIERPSVNIFEPPFRGSRAPLSSSREILQSEGSASPTSKYHTPARIRKSFPRTLDIGMANQFEGLPYGSSSSSSQSSSVSSKDSDSSVLYTRPTEGVPLLPPTPRSPNIDTIRQPIARHPYRRSSPLNSSYGYSTAEGHRSFEEDTRETWGGACLDCLCFSVLFVLFTFVIFSYTCIVLLLFRNWSRT